MNKHIIRLTSTFFIGLLALPTLLHINARPTVRASANTVITTRSSQSYIDSYYSSISPTATGNTLKSSLESLLKAERNRTFSYGSHQTAAFLIPMSILLVHMMAILLVSIRAHQ